MRNILFLIIAAAAFASQARPDERSWLVGYANGTSSYIPDKRVVLRLLCTLWLAGVKKFKTGNKVLQMNNIIGIIVNE